MEVTLKTVKVEDACCSVTDNSCRLCLLDDGIKINIFDDEGADRNVADKISACFPIMIYKSDPLPKSICHKCLFKLETTYEFRQLCLDSNEFLKSRLLVNTDNPQVLEYCNSLKRTAQETLQIRSDYKDVAVNTDSDDMLTDTQSFITSTVTRNLSVDTMLPIEVKSEVEDFDQSQLAHITDGHEDSVGQFSVLESATEETGFNETVEANSVNNEQIEHPGVSDVCEKVTESENLDFSKKSEPSLPHSTASTNNDGPGSSRKVKQSGKAQQYLQWCIFCQKYLKNRPQLWKHKARCHQIYRCKCKMGFFTLNDMLKHQISHLKVIVNFKDEKLHACTVCDKKFADPEVLKLHNILHNPGFLCTPNFNSSAKNFGFKSELYIKKRNQEVAIENKKRATSTIKSSQNIRLSRIKAVKAPNDSNEVCICKYCDSAFPDPKKMWHHMKTDHKFGLFKCKICNREFKTSSNLGTHMSWHSRCKISHPRWFKPVRKPANMKVCGLCNRSFKTKNEYVLHLNECKTRNDFLPSTSVQTFEKAKVLLPCPLCKMNFGDPSALSLHLKTHSAEQNSSDCFPKMFQCSYCSKAFASRSGLYRHERKHLTGKLARFHCKLCGKKFMSDESFSAHLSTHSFSKTYHCNFCNKIFFNEKLRTNHACSFKIPNFNSQCCGISFTDAASAANHVCGEGSGTTPNSGNLSSSIINTIESFKKKAPLHKSIIVVTDIGYKCILCEEEFATQQSAAGHCRIHKKRVKCPFCNRFINAESIYKHILVYHPDVSKQFRN